jgi:hypothetical protein
VVVGLLHEAGAAVCLRAVGIDLTFLVETPSTYISISARTSACSFLW